MFSTSLDDILLFLGCLFCYWWLIPFSGGKKWFSLLKEFSVFLTFLPLTFVQRKGKMSRIAKEYKKIVAILSDDQSSHDNDAFTASIKLLEPCSGSDLSHWTGIIKGPSDTPYNGHDFVLNITIPPDYPMSPPSVKFEPGRMPHCNVNYQTGEICLDILTRQHWSPAWDLLHVVHAVHQLLSDPVPESPLDVDIANILKARDQSAYYGLVNYHLCKQEGS